MADEPTQDTPVEEPVQDTPVSNPDTTVPTEPPKGLRPSYEYKYERVKEILAAINRYDTAGKEIPVEWAEEMTRLIRECKTEADTDRAAQGG